MRDEEKKVSSKAEAQSVFTDPLFLSKKFTTAFIAAHSISLAAKIKCLGKADVIVGSSN